MRYGDDLLTIRSTAVVAAIDASGAGRMEFLADSGVVVISLVLPVPSFSVSAGGALTMQGTPLTAAAIVDGVVVRAQFCDATGAVIISGLTVAPVGGNDADVMLHTVSFLAGQTFKFEAGQISPPVGNSRAAAQRVALPAKRAQRPSWRRIGPS